MHKGRRPEGTVCCPRDLLPRTNKTEVEAAILLYIARRDPIYIIYIGTTFSVLAVKRNTFQVFKTMEHAATTKINDAVTMRQ